MEDLDNNPTTYEERIRGKPIVTIILIVLMVAIYLLEDSVIPVLDYAFTPSLAFSRPWTFITSIFLHAPPPDASHIFSNMFALFLFGFYLESRITVKNYLLIFFLAGILGNIGYMITTSDANIPALGASGAIYGIMGTLAILIPFQIIPFIYMPMIVAVVFWALIEFLGLFAPSGIAHGSHLAGLFIGVAFGLYLRIRKR